MVYYEIIEQTTYVVYFIWKIKVYFVIEMK